MLKIADGAYLNGGLQNFCENQVQYGHLDASMRPRGIYGFFPSTALALLLTVLGLVNSTIGPRKPGRVLGLTILNEVFLTPDGRAFDGTGIPPDIQVPVFAPSDLAAGWDPAMAKRSRSWRRFGQG